LPLSGLAGNNPASCREKNTPTPHIIIKAKPYERLLCSAKSLADIGQSVTFDNKERFWGLNSDLMAE
jgi:hypothetical protein